jgi:hypothetical protein
MRWPPCRKAETPFSISCCCTLELLLDEAQKTRFVAQTQTNSQATKKPSSESHISEAIPTPPEEVE